MKPKKQNRPKDVPGFSKGGNVTSSKEQAFENNKAENLVYPGPGHAPGLQKGGAVKRK